MKLLITTQAVDLDNPYLASFHSWICEFAKRCETVTVLCLEEGRHELPANVRILHLGKNKYEKLNLKRRLEISWRFLSLVISQRANYDTVFAHMNPEYVCLGGWLWRIWGKKIALWYTHRQVNPKLRLATVLSDEIFTASTESFRIKSKKVHIIGHGIDVERFANEPRKKPYASEPIRIVSVGRITRIKNSDVLIDAAEILKKEWDKKFEIIFIGEAVREDDRDYKKTLEKMVAEKGLTYAIKFAGMILPPDLPGEFASADLSVNLSPTGGLDKAVLESMSSALPAISSNQSFGKYFGAFAQDLLVRERDPRGLSDAIMKIARRNELEIIGRSLQQIARANFGVSGLIEKIVETLGRDTDLGSSESRI